MNKTRSRRVRIQYAKDSPKDSKSKTLLSIRTEGNRTAPTGITVFFLFPFLFSIHLMLLGAENVIIGLL